MDIAGDLRMCEGCQWYHWKAKDLLFHLGDKSASVGVGTKSQMKREAWPGVFDPDTQGSYSSCAELVLNWMSGCESDMNFHWNGPLVWAGELISLKMICWKSPRTELKKAFLQ